MKPPGGAAPPDTSTPRPARRPAAASWDPPRADDDLATLLARIRACRACAAHLPLGPRPILQAGATARLLIVGQAPGTKVHASGIPWYDASGERLRDWLGLDKRVFYDPSRVAIVPMGYCYPGRGRGGDLPPRRECAQLWLEALLARLPNIELTLLLGQYAQRHYLGAAAKASLTETVAAFADYAPRFIPLPHPSPRNTAWFQRHPWFERELLPVLRARVQALFAPSGTLDLPGGGGVMTKRSAVHDIVLQRAYAEPGAHDGYRVLVDHFWPRGRSKDTLRLDEWARELAPSADLIHWFGHDPARWDEFRRRYREELAAPAQRERLQVLLAAAGSRRLTLVYGARSETENQAVVLREALMALE
ncbi:MAG: DUF488 family protein [Rhodanobacteraceae bacterium]|jgi:uracil-DNA glycosylase/uncharacterized protein YeaO (DUF488 family)|nr:DUF488 family protein [Rhodanobacteraceae bacterium]